MDDTATKAEPKRLCLNMIVRNEMANLPRCLDAVAPHIACWVIGDTGSTDGTQAFIQAYFAERGIPGELHSFPFVNFEQARNAALDHAYAAPLSYDYLLFDDADMELVVEDPNFRCGLDAPGYQVIQRTNSELVYYNTRLVRRDAGARYRGVTHEYLDLPGRAHRLRSVWYFDHASGSNRVDKFERDARLLEEALKQDPDNHRTWYYLAQSYRDGGKMEEAAEAYAKRAAMGGWDEEAWNARLNEARCLRGLGDEAGFLRAALQAFNQRPWRAEPLHDLARHYRERGMNDASILFSEAGLAIPRPEQDTLFIEDFVYTAGLREEYSIAANYSPDPVRKGRGHVLCEWLALSREAPEHSRNLARQNLFFYIEPAVSLMPSFSAQPIKFAAPEGFHPLNPSVTRHGEQIMLVQRTGNWSVTEDGDYSTVDGEPVRTRNFLLELDAQLDTRSCLEILTPANFPAPLYPHVLGFEDMRLFSWQNKLWCSSTVRELTAEGWCQQVMARIDRAKAAYRLTHWDVLTPSGSIQRHEKNWMPLVEGDVLRFIYSCGPTRVLDEQARTLSETQPAFAAEQFRGSSQVIPFDGGWLALIHEIDFRDGKRCYQHRFAWFDPASVLQLVSPRFYFQIKGIEFAAGMAWHPDMRRLIISYGVADSQAMIATVDANDVKQVMEVKSNFELRAHAGTQGAAEPLAAFSAQSETPSPVTPAVVSSPGSILPSPDRQLEDYIALFAAPARVDDATWNALWSTANRMRADGEEEGFLRIALKSFFARPRQAEPLHMLARYYLDKLMQNVAAVYAEAGLALAYQPNDCVHTEQQIYATGMQEAFSIAAAYSDDADQKARGRAVCTSLAFGHDIPTGVRGQARSNLRWYAEPAQTLLPSISFHPLSVTSPGGFEPSNISVVRDGPGYIVSVRMVNHILMDGFQYDLGSDTSHKSHVRLLALDSEFNVVSEQDVHEPADMPPPQNNEYLGFEDSRLFQWRGDLWSVSSVCQLNTEGRSEIVLARVDRSVPGCAKFADWRVIESGKPPSWEKNWMPRVVGDDLHLIYSVDPTRIISESGNVIREEAAKIAAENFKGGSQAIPFNDGWLMIIHEWEWLSGTRKYLHRFLWFDETDRLRALSHRFFFTRVAAEVAMGLAWEISGERLVIGFSVDEREPYLAAVDAREVTALLLPLSAHTRAADKVVEDSLGAWKALTMGLDEWVFSQTNRALQEWTAVEYAHSATLRARLPIHPDRSKTWDNLLALVHTVRTTQFEAPVLDAGAGRESAYLPSLRALGYVNLTGINIVEKNAETINGIRYCYGNITATDFSPQHFGFVACLSVLEHGVDWRMFLREVTRILMDGGHLFVSVDYWPEPVDTGTRVWFDVPAKIFTAAEMSELVAYAEGLGLRLVGDFDARCKRAPISNDGLRYTFLNLLFVHDIIRAHAGVDSRDQQLVVTSISPRSAVEGDVDLAIQEGFFADPDYRGTMVEVGAAKPDYLSVSASFRSRSWRVISIEPNPYFCELHRRLGLPIIECACGESDQDDVSFFIVRTSGIYHGERVTDESFSSLGVRGNYANLMKSIDAELREIKVKVRRLDTILLEHAPDIGEIDIVCVDVEGWELEVLNGLSFDTYRPKVFIVENLFMQKSYSDYMKRRGYLLWRHIDPNDIFVRLDLLSGSLTQGSPHNWQSSSRSIINQPN